MCHFVAVWGSRYSFRESNYSHMIELTKLMLYLKVLHLTGRHHFFGMGIKNDNADRQVVLGFKSLILVNIMRNNRICMGFNSCLFNNLKKDKFWEESKYENIISNFISVPTFAITSRVMPEAFTRF